MTYPLMTVAQCAELCRLGPQEIVLGVSPSAMHDSLLDSYLLQRHLKWAGVRDMIIADLRIALDLGAKKRAADLLIVLRRFLSGRRSSSDGARPSAAAAQARASAHVVELMGAVRREPAFRRLAPVAGNILAFDAERRRRRLGGGGGR